MVGGYVYRGTRYPALQGAYVFGDYCSGVIRCCRQPTRSVKGTAASADARQPSRTGSSCSFGQGDDGELYAVDFGGRILHIAATPAD